MPSPYNWSAADNAFLVKAIKSKGSVAGALAVICERLGRDFAHSTIYQRYHRILRGELPTESPPKPSSSSAPSTHVDANIGTPRHYHEWTEEQEVALVKAAESATDKSSGIKAFLQQSGLQVSFNAARSKYYMLTVPELGGKRAEWQKSSAGKEAKKKFSTSAKGVAGIKRHASSAKGKATRKRLNHRKWSQMTPEERKAKNDKRSKKSKEQREEAEIRSTRVFAADG